MHLDHNPFICTFIFVFGYGGITILSSIIAFFKYNFIIHKINTNETHETVNKKGDEPAPPAQRKKKEKKKNMLLSYTIPFYASILVIFMIV